LSEGQPKRVEASGTPVLLVKKYGRICALAETCSHAGGPLSEGKIERDTVVCPWHGSRFCLRDGSVIDGPATMPQPVLDVQVRDGQVLVRARQA
jgi:nitrite reductase/ring-hydroxylating ferredoxin subunit